MSTQSYIDPQVVEQTRAQIRDLMEEITELARSDLIEAEFFREVFDRLLAALAAAGAAVWRADERGALSLAYQVQLAEVGLPTSGSELAAHSRLIDQAMSAPRGLCVQPHANVAGDQTAANPTGHLLLLAPLACEGRRYGVVEVFQRTGGSPLAVRGYLRFVLEASQLVGEYLKRHELRGLVGRQALWTQFEEFCRAIHAGLNVRRTALVVANDGRRLIHCDRLSVAVVRAGRLRIEAVSGQEHFDRRATAVRLLDRLVRTAAACREAVWYTGETRDLPPQIEAAVEAYVDQTEHSKSVGILPLFRPEVNTAEAARSSAQKRTLVGALVVEQFREGRLGDDMQERIRVVREHAALALSNASEHDGIFLMPLWRALGRCRAVAATRALPKALVAIAAAALLVAAMLIMPADFAIEAGGSLEPAVRRDIFVREGGVVEKVLVDHGQRVAENDGLVELRSRDLEVSITDLIGRKAATEEQINSLRRARGESRLSSDDQSRLAGQVKELEKTSENLARQLDLLLKKQQQLRLTSPISGQVVTWDVKNLLEHRPVEKGQVLMTVADPDDRWQLELRVRDDRMGHVARAWKEAQATGTPLEVEYLLATSPGIRRRGTVTEMDSVAEVRGEEGNTVLVRVAIDRDAVDPTEIRPGATVTARIQCGRRTLGYVWFHDLIAAIRSKILFKL